MTKGQVGSAQKCWGSLPRSVHRPDSRQSRCSRKSFVTPNALGWIYESEATLGSAPNFAKLPLLLLLQLWVRLVVVSTSWSTSSCLPKLLCGHRPTCTVCETAPRRFLSEYFEILSTASSLSIHRVLPWWLRYLGLLQRSSCVPGWRSGCRRSSGSTGYPPKIEILRPPARNSTSGAS